MPTVLGSTTVSSGLVHTALLGLVGFVVCVVCTMVVIATDRPLAVLGRFLQEVWNRRPGRHVDPPDWTAGS